MGPTADIDAPLDALAGVGTARAKLLADLGVRSLADLLEYFPHRYQYESSERDIGRLVSGQIQIARGTVVAVDYVPARPRPRFVATLDDGTGQLEITWFHGGYLIGKICPDQTIRVQGAVRIRQGRPGMINPKWAPIDPEAKAIEQAKYRPVYSASGRLPSQAIEQIVAGNLERALDEVEEWFSPELLERRGLMGRREAYRAMHRPKDQAEAQRGRRRLVYDELMLMQLGLGISKRLRDGPLAGPAMRMDQKLDGRIKARFPFQLTAAQGRAVGEIVGDLRSGKPMNRLLQGDVGSGKTVVALYAMLTAVANKFQCALLAPTEVLAEQHYMTISNMLAGSKVRVGLFTARSKTKVKANALALGKVHLAIGTQALLQEDVKFANLGLVVVDEQHKLGVRQRAVLTSVKGSWPHYLVMTATPIPRTLALSYFADFDVTTIDALPPGRRAIETMVYRPTEAKGAYELLRREVRSGRQGYVVLPRIEDDGVDDAKSVRKEFTRLSEGALKGVRLGMLHGQLELAERQRTMAAFRDGSIDVLVATTVIEVGIDVPNATVMLIDNADRFGLSQLHQLRGRVGRGAELSYCLLVAEPGNEEAKARLGAMAQTGDGFKIAEMDLRLRGPGEFFGTRQHGLPEFKVADVSKELELLKVAREDAMAILAKDPRLANHHPLASALRKRFGERLPLGRVG